MNIVVRKYEDKDIPEMTRIWNEVVEDGKAFPQLNCLGEDADEFFSLQSYCGVAEDTDTNQITGMYILHPNNIGRCSHISNASYAVKSNIRGKHIGELLVKDCMEQAKRLGFRILQFNAVVMSNQHARHLYERLGFIELGTVPGGFLNKDNVYEDIVLYYHVL